MFYVYVIQNEHAEWYIGSTSDLRRRISEHNAGKSRATRGATWTLVYYETFRVEKDARDRERKLKYHGQAKRRLKDRLRNSLIPN